MHEKITFTHVLKTLKYVKVKSEANPYRQEYKLMELLNLSIPGLTIGCKIWGNPNNPPILALHGWLDNANSFDYLAQLLQEQFYVVAVDLPGHGHSSHLPTGCNYHFCDGIFIVIEIMNALKFEQVHLLGHSMGACLASLVAGVCPKRFLSVSLIEGLGPFSHPPETAYKQLSDYLGYLTYKGIKKSRGYDTYEKAALARAQAGYVTLNMAKTLCERGIYEDKGVYYWRHDRRLLVPSPLYMTEIQVLSCLQQIKSKTLLIWASKGFTFDSKLMDVRIKSIEHLRVEQLDGGHHIHMEQPEVVADLLAEFIKS